ncbi:MAG: hypothetical protein H0T76_19605 [Nannocystis sp.]|nr:hypothetical protein [Nannocystis sp.]MBA3548698.1 hypothetical protein [Nannocystis sp.]
MSLARPHLVLLLALLPALACGRRELRELSRASDDVATAVRRGDARALSQHVVVGARHRVDYAAILADKQQRASWARGLARPDQVRPGATLFVAPDQPLSVVWTGQAWVFAEDPTLLYDQSSPRAALRSLVRASTLQRWDVLLALAPERYRLGLSEDDLRRAWTEGEYASALQTARERLQKHLAEPIVHDAHEAVLDLGDGEAAHLEREGSRWVVVDF